LLQTLPLRTVTDYREMGRTGLQKLSRCPQGEIASLKRNEAAHKYQSELSFTRCARSDSSVEEGRVDPVLTRNEEQLFSITSELLESV
jgi:hypothetical protein